MLRGRLALIPAWIVLLNSGLAGEVKDLRVENPLLRSPLCMNIDDPGPFTHPIAVYKAFGEWAQKNGIKGKFSLIPCAGGRAAVDGSAGEFPGHTKEERLEWIEMFKTLFAPNWSFTPECATHWFPWDFKHQRIMLEQPVEHIYLDSIPLENQTKYIAETMRLWKNVGVELDGLTTPWGGWKNVARNTSEALYEIYKKDFSIYFAEYGEEPALTYEDKENHRAAVSLRCLTSAFDGKRIEAGKPSVPCYHVGIIEQKDHWAGIEKLNQEYGDRLLWMTGREIGLYYYTKARLAWSAKEQDNKVALSLSTLFETPCVTVSFTVAGLDLDKLIISLEGKALARIKARGKEFAPQTWFVEQGRVYLALKQLKSASLLLDSAH